MKFFTRLVMIQLDIEEVSRDGRTKTYYCTFRVTQFFNLSISCSLGDLIMYWGCGPLDLCTGHHGESLFKAWMLGYVKVLVHVDLARYNITQVSFNSVIMCFSSSISR